MSVAALLQESTTEQDLLMLEETLGDDCDMLTEALDSSTCEVPAEDDDVNSLQFFNQDQLDGVSDADLNTYHPDNTDALNSVGVGGAMAAPLVSTSSITRSLLSEAAGDGITGDGANGSQDYEDQSISGSTDMSDAGLDDLSDELDDEFDEDDDESLIDSLL